MSSRNDWATPEDLFGAISGALGPFTLDVAASHANTKVAEYYTISEDALSHEWQPGWWCNPPYSKLGISVLPEWCAKFVEQAAVGNWGVALLPYDSSTGWFNDLVLPNADAIVLLCGPRIEFVDPTGAQRDQPRGTHFVARFTNYEQRIPPVFWNWRKEPLRLNDELQAATTTIERLQEQNKKLFKRYQGAQEQIRRLRISGMYAEDETNKEGNADDDDDESEERTQLYNRLTQGLQR